MHIDESGRFPIFHLNEFCRVMPCSVIKGANTFNWLIVTHKVVESTKRGSLTREDSFIAKIDLNGLARDEKSQISKAVTPKGFKSLRRALKSCLVGDLLPTTSIPKLKELLMQDASSFLQQQPRRRKPRTK